MREVAFIPTRKDEICMVRRSTLRRKKISSPEVLDIAASSETVGKIRKAKMKKQCDYR
jgi:hypothetical protein